MEVDKDIPGNTVKASANEIAEEKENEGAVDDIKETSGEGSNDISSETQDQANEKTDLNHINDAELVMEIEDKRKLNIDKCDEDINKNEMLNKEVQEEDVPESFFDDLMSEDFFEGLNVVDTWEGDEIINPDPTEDNLKERDNDKKESRLSHSHSNNNDRNKEIHKAKDRYGERKRSHKRDRRLRSCSTDREQNRSKRSGSKSKNKISDSASRRDPNKTNRDILRDKDKCEKDKSAKILHEKLKVVETGLVPPGMEMEVDIQSSDKTNKLEDGEIAIEQEESEKEKKSLCESKEEKDTVDQKRNSRHSKIKFPRDSPYKRSLGKKDISPGYRRESRRVQSRSRSPRRRISPRNRSRSIEKRTERRRRSFRRSRSRSLDLRSPSRERHTMYRVPLRKTSPLVKRNKQPLIELNQHKRIYSSNRISPHRNLLELAQLQILSSTPNMNTAPNFMNSSAQFQSMASQNYLPVQPVPPPHQMHVELDQQFFIGQQTFEPSNYLVPIQQPSIMQNQPMMHLTTPEVPHNFQQNWHMEEPYQESMAFFNSNNQYTIDQNMYQQPITSSLGFMQNQASVQPQELQVPLQKPEQNFKPAPTKTKNEDEIFAKLFADNKITLSDYLSVTAKSTDNSNPVDIQNKIKVISYCQEALSEINGTSKATGKFLLRKSQKDAIKPSNAEGLSPFKKVPAVKFQFTTIPKQFEDKLHLSSSLNRLLVKLGKEVLFQETQQSPSIAAKAEDTPKITRTSNIATQTDLVSTSDFGCQVTSEDISSPSKSILKKQSLAKLTPAQLLAQEEKEASPPPAPRWTLFPESQMSRRGNEAYWDFDNLDWRNPRKTEVSGWSIPGRNVGASGHYTRSPDDLHHLHQANRHQNF